MGKYGDPNSKVPALWKFYVEEKNNYPHPNAERPGKGKAADKTNRSSKEDASTNSGGGSSSGQPGTSVQRTSSIKPTRTTLAKFVSTNKPDTPGTEEARTEEYTFVLDKDERLTLSVPESQQGWWRKIDDAGSLTTPQIQPRLEDALKTIRFPIFIPSSRRADSALLNIAASFPNGERYNQIVTVKQKEFKAYRKSWPGLTFLILPESASEKGNGASRYWMQRFAEEACETDFKFCFVLDDTVQYWKGK
jgi:hypothetical protein